MKAVCLFSLTLLLAVAGPLLKAEERFTRQELAHAFGTDPSFTHYPASAVDTDDAPNLVLGAEDAPDAPLHFYEIAEDTYFLYGNIAEDGCIVKTAGVDMSMFDAEQLRYTTSVPTSTLRGFVGPARIYESQDAAVEAILSHEGVAPSRVVPRA